MATACLVGFPALTSVAIFFEIVFLLVPAFNGIYSSKGSVIKGSLGSGTLKIFGGSGLASGGAMISIVFGGIKYSG